MTPQNNLLTSGMCSEGPTYPKTNLVCENSTYFRMYFESKLKNKSSPEILAISEEQGGGRWKFPSGEVVT